MEAQRAGAAGGGGGGGAELGVRLLQCSLSAWRSTIFLGGGGAFG